MRRLKIYLGSVFLLGCLVSFFWYAKPKKEVVPAMQETRPVVDLDEDEEVLVGFGETPLLFKDEISNIEFNHLEVSLPDPIDADWNGNFFNSRNMFSAEHVDAAVNVLPIWIRKSIREGNRDLAARYLHSLISLIEHEDFKISSAATFHLYRMGDYNKIAFLSMQSWIQEGISKPVYYSDIIRPDVYDVRAVALQEAMYRKDVRMVDYVADKWKVDWAEGKDDPSVIDYAFYLEINGVNLPHEYWEERLLNSLAIRNTLEVISERELVVFKEPLEALFEKSLIRDQRGQNQKVAAQAAGVLYGMTEDGVYLDYLLSEVDAYLNTGTVGRDLSYLFEALAEIEHIDAQEIFNRSVMHSNEVIRKLAVQGLSGSNSKEVTDILVSTALDRVVEENRFPTDELMSLAIQGSEYATGKYKHLKTGLLSGEYNWAAQQSHFEITDFILDHGLADRLIVDYYTKNGQ